jgi:hypothetical protein
MDTVLDPIHAMLDPTDTLLDPMDTILNTSLLIERWGQVKRIKREHDLKEVICL